MWSADQENPLTKMKKYPDFRVLNVSQRKEFIWEHFGMMDNPEYIESALRKIETYKSAGIYVGESLIVTWETMDNPLSTEMIKRNINHFLLNK